MDYRRKNLIRKLLNVKHLNVQERQELGPFPTFKEVLKIVVEHFSEFRYLPGEVKNWKPEIFCYEGFVLEKTNDPIQPYTVHYQEVGPALDFRGSVDTKYSKLDYAITVYLQKEYNNNIDGIPIVFE